MTAQTGEMGRSTGSARSRLRRGELRSALDAASATAPRRPRHGLTPGTREPITSVRVRFAPEDVRRWVIRDLDAELARRESAERAEHELTGAILALLTEHAEHGLPATEIGRLLRRRPSTVREALRAGPFASTGSTRGRRWRVEIGDARGRDRDGMRGHGGTGGGQGAGSGGASPQEGAGEIGLTASIRREPGGREESPCSDEPEREGPGTAPRAGARS
jgi:hypothetical protein